MVNKLVNLRMNAKLISAVDSAVKLGFYDNRGELIKEAVREKLDSLEYKMRLKEGARKLAKIAVEKGWDGRMPTKAERDKIAMDFLKEKGFNLE